MFWEAPLDPDTADRYGFTMDSEWLDGEAITNVVFTAPVESGINVTNISYAESPTITAMFSGGEVGFWPIHVRVETTTRQRELSMTLWVKDS